MGYRLMRRPWRAKAPLYWVMPLELAGIIPLLILFALAQPDAWRTQFWRIGHAYKLNSSPSLILYAYANFRPLPAIPFVWSSTLTYFNVAISIVALFVLLAKMIATIMKIYYPIFGLLVSTALTSVYAVSVYGQAGPDYLDPRYPSPVPWYIRKSCDLAIPFNAVKSCHMAKGTFAVTVYLLAIFVFQVGFALWAMWPNKMLDLMDDSDDDEHLNNNHNHSPGGHSKDKGVESVEMTPVSAFQGQMPFTPRTQAFHTLDRKLPLRDAYR